MLLPLATPVHADPGDVDATRQDPVLLAPGSYTGNLSPTDIEDWYKVAVPAGQGVRVAVTAAELLDVHMRDGSGTSLPRTPATYENGMWTKAAFGASRDFVYVQIATNRSLDYILTVSLHDIPDLSVVSVEAEARDECLEGVPCAAAVRIAVTLENVGSLPYRGKVVLFAQGDILTPVLQSYGLEMAPGTRVTVVHEWRPLAAGKVTFLAAARSAEDVGWWNDRAETTHHVLVEADRGVVVA